MTCSLVEMQKTRTLQRLDASEASFHLLILISSQRAEQQVAGVSTTISASDSTEPSPLAGPLPSCSKTSLSVEIHPGGVLNFSLWATAAVFAGCHLFDCYFSDFIFKQYKVEHRNTAHRTDGEQSQTDYGATLTEDTGVGEESQTARLLKANKYQ